MSGKPEYVRSSAEKSLKRLGVDTIDLYYLHVSFFHEFGDSQHLISVQSADPTVPIEVCIYA